jgi:hypothetical protein
MAAGLEGTDRSCAMRVLVRTVWMVAAASWLAACAPEVGSPKWCEAMKEKPRGDWTANEALDFARNCVL